MLSAYSGPDSVGIDDVYLVVSLVDGKLPFATRFTLILSLDKQFDKLELRGPRFPITVEPYGRIDWKLPYITVVPHARHPHPVKRPGLCMLDPYDSLEFRLLALTRGRKPTASLMRYGIKFGFVTHDYTYDTLAELLGDDTVPRALRNLLEPWAKVVAPKEPSSERGRKSKRKASRR